METILVQVTNQKAYRLLQDLEDLNVLRVLSKKQEPKEDFVAKYWGKLSDEGAKLLNGQIEQSRNEWNP